MKITVSAEDLKGLDPLPDGKYRATIGKPEFTKANEEGKSDYYAIPFSISETPDGAPRRLTRRFSLSPKAMWAWGPLLQALGLKVEGKAMEFDPDELEGGEVLAIVTQHEHEGRIFNDIKSFAKAK